MDLDELFQQAKANAEKLPNGTVFSVRDLFEGTFWDSLEKGKRLQFGGVFKRKVNTGQVQGVSYLKKAANNSALYQVIKG